MPAANCKDPEGWAPPTSSLCSSKTPACKPHGSVALLACAEAVPREYGPVWRQAPEFHRPDAADDGPAERLGQAPLAGSAVHQAISAGPTRQGEGHAPTASLFMASKEIRTRWYVAVENLTTSR